MNRPVPELVDARLTSDKKTLVLFLRENGVHFTRRLNLQKGGGLYSIWPTDRLLVFARGARIIEREDYVREQFVSPILVKAGKDLAETLAFVLWGREEKFDTWGRTGDPPAQEDVRALPEHENAAD
ncbi:hypothetical protein [Deinococcus apachensis]|uniref:hypothetical protein n=1 Tax=Deinococcus apachensis TaxID=309886 RepID=UPI000362166A|nr:hypothetical protein [Deinococcus apachensis]